MYLHLLVPSGFAKPATTISSRVIYLPMQCCSGFEKAIFVFVQIKIDEKVVLMREKDYLLNASQVLTLTRISVILKNSGGLGSAHWDRNAHFG